MHDDTTRHLFDSDTTEDLGPATPAQIVASDAAGEEGHILIDTEGHPCDLSSWDAQQPGVRRVYVEEGPENFVLTSAGEVWSLSTLEEVGGNWREAIPVRLLCTLTFRGWSVLTTKDLSMIFGDETYVTDKEGHPCSNPAAGQEIEVWERV